jgi:hypothetical protein
MAAAHAASTLGLAAVVVLVGLGVALFLWARRRD